MKKILIPIIALVCGTIIGTVWFYGMKSSQSEHFEPFRMGEYTEQVAPFVEAHTGKPLIALVEGSFQDGVVRIDKQSLKPDQEYVHEFILRNAGEGVLEIKLDSTSSGCVCDDVSGGKTVTIEPGKAHPFAVKWNESKDFVGEVKLKTNDTTQPMVTLQVSGHYHD